MCHWLEGAIRCQLGVLRLVFEEAVEFLDRSLRVYLPHLPSSPVCRPGSCHLSKAVCSTSVPIAERPPPTRPGYWSTP